MGGLAMRVCLMSLKTDIKNPPSNLRRFNLQVERIARDRPDLICLPECAFTGYLCEEDEVRRFAETVPGPAVVEVAQIAQRHRVHICFGLLERAPSGVYNSAVLLDRQGRVLLLHRKIVEQPPFLNGTQVESVETELGKLGILICGDLFDDEAVGRIASDLRLLLVPMARCFDGRSPDQERWEREERSAYLEAVRRTKVSAVVVNALEIGTAEGSFGGAMVIGADGSLLAESPHGSDNILMHDFVGGSR
jgi:N-carbamoylputrescine amidase